VYSNRKYSALVLTSPKFSLSVPGAEEANSDLLENTNLFWS
jgi:hypothetical protein